MNERPPFDKFAPLTKADFAAVPAGAFAATNDDGECIMPAPADAPPMPLAHPEWGKPCSRWHYHDEEGALLYEVWRFDLPDGGKEIRPLSLWREPSDALRWKWKAIPRQRPLYGLHSLAARPGASVVICEGEKACDAAAKIFPRSVCITSSGGSQAATKANWSPIAGRRVMIWPDADEAGVRYAMDVAAILLARGCEVSIIDAKALASIAPDGGTREPLRGWDAADAVKEWQDPGALRKAAHGLANPFDAAWATPNAQSSNWQAALTCASIIKPEPISWLWKGWFARGKMHIIAGQPGTGKTTIAVKIAATVSSGGRLPDGTRAPKGNVIIWSGEDDPADTLVPRLEASGSDLSKVFFAGDMTCGKEVRSFDPAKDILALQAAIEAAGGAALIIIDPIVSATAADSHKNCETRRALQPLVDMAAKLGAALIGITHFTKGSEGRSPIDRVTGSVAFGALARIVMVAVREGDGGGEPGKRIFMRAKSNIGPDDGGFEYDLQQAPMRSNPEIIASVLAWGNAVEGTARDILAAAETVDEDNGAATAFGEAKDFLLDFLLDGPKAAKAVQAAAREATHSWATMRRAKDALGVVSAKNFGDGTWTWSLPQDAQRKATCPTTPNPENLEHLEHLERLQGKQLVSNGQRVQHAQHAQGFGVEHLGADGGWEGEI